MPGSHLKFSREVHCTKKCCTQSTAFGDRALGATKDTITTEPTKRLPVVSSNVRGGFFRTLDRRAAMRAATKAPQRKRPCRSRALPVDLSPSSLHSLYGRDLARVRCSGESSVACHWQGNRQRRNTPSCAIGFARASCSRLELPCSPFGERNRQSARNPVVAPPPNVQLPDATGQPALPGLPHSGSDGRQELTPTYARSGAGSGLPGPVAMAWLKCSAQPVQHR